MIHGIPSLCAQSITPHTFNNGGGYNATMEWSIGDGVSIEHFLVGGLSVNTGVLQPMTNIVTGISEYGPAVFGNQISMGPNPTTSLLHIRASMSQVGNLSVQIMDSKSAVLIAQDAGTIFSTYEKDISMQGYADGVFYVRVYFKSNNSVAKVGIYKIIKISK